MPGTHVWPHTGPTNCRLRMHLGLVIPKTGNGTKLRCGDEIRFVVRKIFFGLTIAVFISEVLKNYKLLYFRFNFITAFFLNCVSLHNYI